MKIVYFADTFPKISETFVRDEALWMNDRGWLQEIITLNSDRNLLSTINSDLSARLLQFPIKYVGRSARLLSTAYWLIRAPRRFLRTYQQIPEEQKFVTYFWNAALLAKRFSVKNSDVLHVHFAGQIAQIVRYVSLLTEIPFTVCIHHYDLFYNPPSNYPELARDAALLFTISDYNRAYLTKIHAVPKNRIRVVHCGIDIEQFQRDTHQRLDNAKVWKIVAVGRLTEIKGHKHLVTACALLVQRHIDFRLNIIGDGELREDLEKQIDSLGMNDYVTLRGAQSTDAVRAELHQADLFVMPSLSEGIPVALMEAMATELPVIATRIRGVPELVQHNITGMLVEPGNSEQIFQAIVGIIADSGLRVRLGRAARSKVSVDFNAATEYAKLAKIWKKEIVRKRERFKAHV